MSNTFELNEEMLRPVVQLALDDKTAVPTKFALHALKPGLGNPTSLGVYRASGTASTASGDKPFSVVVKHLADGQPIMVASEPTHWNYWRREIVFFESPIAARIPASLAYPRYLGQTELADGTFLFWNGDLGDLGKSVWTWDECIHATELVAELNSIDVSDAAEYPWLNRTQPEGWLELREAYFEPAYRKFMQVVETKPETVTGYETYGAWVPKQVEINAIIHSHRQVFAHGDFNLNNLVPSKGDRGLIALDWQLCGMASVGSEISAIYNTAHELGVTPATQERFEQLCEVYTRKFNQLNPENPVELDDVRLAAAARGYMIICGVGFFLSVPNPELTDAENDATIQRLIENFATGPLMVYARVLNELA
ncbi:MAG: hypothetical protein RLZZ626_266 [Actinomycetota bacterium]